MICFKGSRLSDAFHLFKGKVSSGGTRWIGSSLLTDTPWLLHVEPIDQHTPIESRLRIRGFPIHPRTETTDRGSRYSEWYTDKKWVAPFIKRVAGYYGGKQDNSSLNYLLYSIRSSNHGLKNRLLDHTTIFFANGGGGLFVAVPGLYEAVLEVDGSYPNTKQFRQSCPSRPLYETYRPGVHPVRVLQKPRFVQQWEGSHYDPPPIKQECVWVI